MPFAPSLSTVVAAVLSALIFGFGSGGGLFYWALNGEITTLNTAIDAQKKEAAEMLSAAENRLKEERATAQENKRNMEASHDKNSKTITALQHDLATARMFDPGRRPGGGNATPDSGRAGLSQGEAGSGELSAELTRFLQIKFYAADKVAEYANQCYTFVVEQNCGIARNGS